MQNCVVLALTMAMAGGTAVSALAQRLPFARTLEVSGSSKLDVSTMRGKIDVTVGSGGRVAVAGTVTIRVGVDVPANALEIARRLVENPPIEREGNTIRLRPPADRTDQRAVTISYQVTVPRATEVLAISDSGATTVREVSGPVVIRTQSAAIEVHNLGGSAAITTGSGAVTSEGVGGALTVTTSSSAFTGRSLNGSVRVRTTSGAVDAGLAGNADADVETHSSAIRLTGARGGVKATSQSGRITLDGSPQSPWNVSTRSGSVELSISSADFALDAETGSGSVKVEHATVQGTVSKKKAAGNVGAGGPLVKITSRSGSIRVDGPS